jgi:hypothetical protein
MKFFVGERPLSRELVKDSVSKVISNTVAIAGRAVSAYVYAQRTSLIQEPVNVQ